jgi:class 3 adenylate cyclase
MATEQLLQPTRPETEPCKADRIRAESTLSRRSTTLRPGIRTQHVYGDARDARYHADARLVVPGSAHALEVPRRDDGRFLTTVLMTDIVDSTRTAARLGDWRWRALLIEHYADCRALIANGGGELVSTTGDGIVATFDAPTRAVRTAIAIQTAARRVGIGVRAGVHTGECERLGDGLAGVGVHLTERICALAGADEVLTTGTVRDLVIGSLLAFEPRGRHALRGVPRDWTVFSATDPA